jgi:hypothetical protein
MAVSIESDHMVCEVAGAVVATARFSQHAAADGNGAWIVSTHAERLFTRNQAITALTLAERLAAGHDHSDPFVKSWRAELFLPNDATEDAKHAPSVREEPHK